MRGLDPRIPIRDALCSPERDGRDKPGHDRNRCIRKEKCCEAGRIDAHPHHRRGRHDRPQADRAAGDRPSARQPADRQADADRYRRAGAAGGIFRSREDPGRRSGRTRRRGEGGLGAARRDLPSRRRGVGRSRARFRQRLSRQSRRHARTVRGDPQDRRRLQAAGDLHLVDGGVRRAVSRTPSPTISI